MSTLVEKSVKFVVVTPTPRTEMERKVSFNSRHMYNFRNKEFSTLAGAQRSLQREISTFIGTINSIVSGENELYTCTVDDFRNELAIVRAFKIGKVTATTTKEIEIVQ